jgi:NAD+ dependent glucose-6-phosphate dehydrogenase
VLCERLAGRYALRLLAREPIDAPDGAADAADAADAAGAADIAELAAIRPAFESVDVVVHLAAAADRDSGWDDVLPANIVGAYNVFEAARVAGVPRVVFASSTHAVGMYDVEGAPDLYRRDDPRTYDEQVELRPDSLYGVSKAFGELLGRYYSERHGLSVICLRIGFVSRSEDASFRAPRDVGAVDRPAAMRARAIWLSHHDCAELFARAIDADPALRWAVAYGTSDNPRRIWDLGSAQRLLGYRPRDRAPE